MAFNNDYWSIASAELRSIPTQVDQFIYNGNLAGDDMDTILGSGYFNDADPAASTNAVILAVATDKILWLSVSGLAPVTTAIVSSADDIELAEAEIIVGQSTGYGAAVALSGDATIIDDGTLTIGAAAVTQSKLDSTIIRNTCSFYIDGKQTLAAWATNTHPKAKLIRAFVKLIQVPDASGTTLTVLIQNATGTVSMSDTLTFTEGVDAADKYKAFTPVTAGGADQILKADVLNIVVGGTTTTAGEVEVTTEWLGIA